MRILLDECLPARLRRDFPGHEVSTVPRAGWAGINNGQLLRLIAGSGKFDVFLTMDKSLPQQQPLKDLPFAVVVLRAKSNRFEDTPVFRAWNLAVNPGPCAFDGTFAGFVEPDFVLARRVGDRRAKRFEARFRDQLSALFCPRNQSRNCRCPAFTCASAISRVIRGLLELAGLAGKTLGEGFKAFMGLTVRHIGGIVKRSGGRRKT